MNNKTPKKNVKIDSSTPHNTMKENTLKRGRREEHSVDELKQLAIKIKKQLNGAKLTHLGLEKLTGIGRNTWARKIPDFLIQLNNPVPSTEKLSDKDNVYFPSASSIYEAYRGNDPRLMNELNLFDQSYFKLYRKLIEVEEENERLKRNKKSISNLTDDVQKYKKQALHYEKLYTELVLTSTFPGVREEKGIINNVIQFDRDTVKNTNMKTLSSFFPTISDSELVIETEASEISEKNINILKQLAPNLFEDPDVNQ